MFMSGDPFSVDGSVRSIGDCTEISPYVYTPKNLIFGNSYSCVFLWCRFLEPSIFRLLGDYFLNCLGSFD